MNSKSVQQLPFISDLNRHLAFALCTQRFTDLAKPKFPDGGSILGSSQFSILPQLPTKILLDSKVVKTDPKILISIH